MRQFCILVLALVVALSSVTMAAARHQPRVAGQMELCTGRGMIVLAVDAQGQPVGPVLPCPDCTPPLLALDAGAALPAAPARTLRPLAFRTRAHAPPVHAAPGFHWSRGPPVPV